MSDVTRTVTVPADDLWGVLEQLEREAAEAARDEAVARVERNADDEWLEAALNAVAALGEGCAEFTTDDVWLLLGRWGVPEPHEARAMGAVMRRAARLGLAVKTDRVRNSVRAECHARPVAVWRATGRGNQW